MGIKLEHALIENIIKRQNFDKEISKKSLLDGLNIVSLSKIVTDENRDYAEAFLSMINYEIVSATAVPQNVKELFNMLYGNS